ncbi:hypothetical protein J8L98_07785 [Pseudoalteromonas sp. MMG013]|uniref:hypothetical protein n=1 Tax=Pseudoalteromonas sp. MMG013 TaxID=2822687 RepID=UPI001B392CFD|nr:hypothetical protein [Pseudoalteromonas sp. MMG013]MBQ4861588.1 hypothetical protein [Pseudoalteromonas sp. MMG013]
MTHINPHLIALINYIVLVPLVYFIPTWVTPYLPNNHLLQVCIVVALIVPIMSYVVMPLVVYCFGKKASMLEKH